MDRERGPEAIARRLCARVRELVPQVEPLRGAEIALLCHELEAALEVASEALRSARQASLEQLESCKRRLARVAGSSLAD
ncbi:MAG: hypothetical protein HYZ28_25080 [Myxococcales bacterium]|nr:hypothetical protein [Myxococcales bacterium]